MKKIKLFLLFFCINFMLLSCGGEVGKIMRNEKIVSTDEFLIKKKGPLSQPPDFNTLPQPGSQINKQDKKDISNILRGKVENTNKSKSSSTESSIMKQIKQ
jgi:hypothetical protein